MDKSFQPLLIKRPIFADVKQYLDSYTGKIFVQLFLINLLLICLIHNSYAYERQKTYVIITIDHCETWPGIISAKIDGKECGIKALIDICDKNGVKPTFFFSLYDYKRVGEDKVKKVAKYIVDRGCDLQLHTHPRFLYDPKRNQMYQYSLEEQIEIIRHGKEKLYEWTGYMPIAHRAGGYSANLDTLRALAVNGIYFDSSSFYKERRSKISAEGMPINILGKKEQVIQVPVSVFQLQEFSSFFGIKFPYLKRIRKVDIDWADYDQIRHAILELKRKNVPTITLFLHFHSLLKGGGSRNLMDMGPDIVDIEEFDRVLKMIRSDGDFLVITFSDFAEKHKKNEIKLPKIDFLPVFEKKISLIQYGRKAVGINARNFKYVILIFVCISVLVTVAVIFYRKRRKNA